MSSLKSTIIYILSIIPLVVVTDLDLSAEDNNNNNITTSFAISATSASAAATYDCELFKLKCHNDTDCFHRIFYAHSTCITGVGVGRCKSQCKTAVLRLYENQFGRKILQSDLSCVEAIRNDIVACNLNPLAERIHCTLARRMCDGERKCRTAATIYEARCESQLMTSDPYDRCRRECAELLADVFRATENGAKLADCVCWEDDALCHHMKSHVIEPCRSEALLYLNNQAGGRRIASGDGGQDLDDQDDIGDFNDREDNHSIERVLPPFNKATTIICIDHLIVMTTFNFVAYLIFSIMIL